jgi:PKD domain
VTYGNGSFMAVADSGTVLRSTDGKSWSLTSVSGNPNFRSVTWDGSVWMALARNTADTQTSVPWTSTDGITWSQKSDLGYDLDRCFSSNGVIYIIGWYTGIQYSTDHGLTWTKSYTPGSTRWSTYNIARAPDGTFLCTARAMDESGTPYALLVSTDGQSWSRTTVNSGNTTIAQNSVALTFGAGSFLSIESGGIVKRCNSFYPGNSAPVLSVSAPTTTKARQLTALSASATDANGDTLTYAWDFDSQSPIIDGNQIGYSFPFGGSFSYTVYVSDGKGGLTTSTQSMTVTDPSRTFTQRTSGTTNGLYAATSSSTLAVVGGSDGKILTSSDGVTWTSRSISEFAANITFRGALRTGSAFLLCGSDYDFSLSAWVGVIYSSPDGITWTRRYKSGAGAELNGFSTNGITILAVGKLRTALQSTDGITWSSLTIPGFASTDELSSTACSGSLFLVSDYTANTGPTPRVMSSSNLSTWTDVTAGVAMQSWNDFARIFFLNDRFVGSGWYSGLLTSTDSGATFTGTRGQKKESLYGAAYGDGIYFTAGIELTNSNADVDVMSLDGTNWYSYPAPTTNDRKAAIFFKHTFITLGANGEIWQSGDTTPAGLSTWQMANFPNGGLQGLPDSDPDQDGVANLIEYAMGRSPLSATGNDGPAGIGSMKTPLSGKPRFKVDLPEPAQSDAIYTLQGATTLGSTWTDLAQKTGTGSWSWLAGGTSQLTLGSISSGRQSVEVAPPTSVNSPARYFYRLKVTQP